MKRIAALMSAVVGVTAAHASTMTVVGSMGGRIFYDGKDVGTIPLRLTAVPAGRHVVRVVTSSGLDRTFDLNYPGGNVDRVVDMDVEASRRETARSAPVDEASRWNPARDDVSYEYVQPTESEYYRNYDSRDYQSNYGVYPYGANQPYYGGNSYGYGGYPGYYDNYGGLYNSGYYNNIGRRGRGRGRDRDRDQRASRTPYNGSSGSGYSGSASGGSIAPTYSPPAFSGGGGTAPFQSPGSSLSSGAASFQSPSHFGGSAPTSSLTGGTPYQPTTSLTGGTPRPAVSSGQATVVGQRRPGER